MNFIHTTTVEGKNTSINKWAQTDSNSMPKFEEGHVDKSRPKLEAHHGDLVRDSRLIQKIPDIYAYNGKDELDIYEEWKDIRGDSRYVWLTSWIYESKR